MRKKSYIFKQGDTTTKRSNMLPPGATTIGTVVDTNDPQQMGRLRVMCPLLGDSENKTLEDIPWALYSTPFGGSSPIIARGAEEYLTSGNVAYGMWAIPKIGAQVLVTTIDNDPKLRVWTGCIYGQFTTHTMPHGRFISNDKVTIDATPFGPISTEDSPIQPLYSNFAKAFVPSTTNYEWKTRGADYSVAAVTGDQIDDGLTNSSFPDNMDPDFRQGYAEDRSFPELKSEVTGMNLDSQTYSWTTPGFHAISMDDRVENCRMRFRSSTGHQVILDDTNERIYISTAQGENWVEMDQNGNIDMFSSRRVSIHAAKDINLTTEDTFRVHAKNGIHMYTSTGDIRMQAAAGSFESKSSGKYNIDATDDVNIKTAATTNIQSVTDTNINSGANINIQSATDTNINSGANINIQSATDTNINSTGKILNTGLEIHFNGPPAQTAGSASTASTAEVAFSVNRVPMHEPFARRLISKSVCEAGGNVDFTAESIYEIPYTSDEVGRKEYDDIIIRGPNWRR